MPETPETPNTSDATENGDLINLRERTEEIELDQYLKNTLGGYTKKSVMEYVGVVRTQRQETAEAFNRNLQTIFREKESLRADNETLRAKLERVEDEYQSLADAIVTRSADDEEGSSPDISSLKDAIVALEEENKKTNSLNRTLSGEIEQFDKILTEKDEESERLRQEVRSQREDLLKRDDALNGLRHEIRSHESLLVEKDDELKKLRQEMHSLETFLVEKNGELEKLRQKLSEQEDLLAAAHAETEQQREVVSNYSVAIKDLQNELDYLKGTYTEEKTSELKNQISELAAAVASHEDTIASLNFELNGHERSVETLDEENAALRLSMDHLARSLDEMMIQNEKLVFSNRALTSKLAEAHANSVELINEKSDVTVEKLMIERKLDEASRRISMFEMEIMKQGKAKSIDEVSSYIAKSKEQ